MGASVLVGYRLLYSINGKKKEKKNSKQKGNMFREMMEAHSLFYFSIPRQPFIHLAAYVTYSNDFMIHTEV